MKTKSAKYFMLAIATLFAAGFSAMAGMGQEGNGGGGVRRGSRVMTIYSAQVLVEKQPLKLAEVPQLSELLAEIQGLELGSSTGGNLVGALYPGMTRQYFRVSEVDSAIRAKLVQIYAQKLKVSEQEVSLFAITDPATKQTLLLPEFYRLSSVEQQAILLHEGYWIVHPKATYDEVIRVETSAQRYLEEKSEAAGQDLINRVGTLIDSLKYAWVTDQKNGVFQAKFGKKEVMLKDLFGDNFIACIASKPDHYKNVRGKSCNSPILHHLTALQQDGLNSRLADLFISLIQQEKFIVIWTSDPLSWSSSARSACFTDFGEFQGLFLTMMEGTYPNRVALHGRRIGISVHTNAVDPDHPEELWVKPVIPSP